MTFASTRIHLSSKTETTTVRVELATTQAQQTMGLMERRSLPEDAGMLFVYPTTQPATTAFWMYRTRIPLDIAYIDSAGVIQSIVAMEPCPATLIQGCPSYPSGAAFRAALEVNRGFFARHRLGLGDHAALRDTSSSQ